MNVISECLSVSVFLFAYVMRIKLVQPIRTTDLAMSTPTPVSSFLLNKVPKAKVSLCSIRKKLYVMDTANE